jgi:4'-phosphopantetheinyl transferase EntD
MAPTNTSTANIARIKLLASFKRRAEMVSARAAAKETTSQSRCEMAPQMRNSDVSPPTDWIYSQ